MSKKKLGILIVGLTLAGMCATSKANSILFGGAGGVGGVGANPTVSGGTFTYGIYLDPGNHLNTGDYFTLYDFQGLSGESNTLTGTWSFSTALVGATPIGQLGELATDNPTLPDATFTFTGPSGTIDATTSSGTLFLGNIVLTTSMTLFSEVGSNYVAQDHDDLTQNVSSNHGSTLVPFNAQGPFFSPVPASLWGGLGLFGVLALGGVRKLTTAA